MEIQPNDPVYSKQVIELLTVANEFCVFTENSEKYESQDIITFYRHILPLLYLKGSVVKPLIPEDPDADERFVTEESWELIFNSLRNKFYPHDHFWMPEEVDGENSNLQKMSLGECIADIYQDMKDFIMLYQKNRYSSRENAIAGITRLFKENYGKKITYALTALHKSDFLLNT